MQDTTRKVKEVVNKLHRFGHINLHVMTHKWSTIGLYQPRIPEFYTLSKIHKKTPVGRPIISGSSGPTECMFCRLATTTYCNKTGVLHKRHYWLHQFYWKHANSRYCDTSQPPLTLLLYTPTFLKNTELTLFAAIMMTTVNINYLSWQMIYGNLKKTPLSLMRNTSYKLMELNWWLLSLSFS